MGSVMLDERQMDENLQRIFQQGGFSFDYKQDTQTDSSESIQMMEQGLGVFSYIGHGSGTAWNTLVSLFHRFRASATRTRFSLNLMCLVTMAISRRTAHAWEK